MTRDRTTESVSRDQILVRRERGQGKNHFPCSADHERDWQPYPVDPYPSYMSCDDHAYMLKNSCPFLRIDIFKSFLSSTAICSSRSLHDVVIRSAFSEMPVEFSLISI